MPEVFLTRAFQSDHPVLDSRFLLYEAQQAHYYGLADNLALLSVTGTPAQVLGEDHRIGFIKTGYDAGRLRSFYHCEYVLTSMQMSFFGIATLLP